MNDVITIAALAALALAMLGSGTLSLGAVLAGLKILMNLLKGKKEE